MLCRDQQQVLGDAGAVQQLVEDLKSLAPAQQQQQGGLVDTLQALLFSCCGHTSNLQLLLNSGAAEQLTQGELEAAANTTYPTGTAGCSRTMPHMCRAHAFFGNCGGLCYVQCSFAKQAHSREADLYLHLLGKSLHALV